jgi:hypothetical protein
MEVVDDPKLLLLCPFIATPVVSDREQVTENMEVVDPQLALEVALSTTTEGDPTFSTMKRPFRITFC